ncbi:MAG: hypothetical protein RIR79_402 [Pseudomonadota bacterium]
MDLHPQLTVLIAENGGGKTAVLDAIRGILAPFLQGITNNTNTNTNIEYINQERDIRRCQKGDWNMEPQLPFSIQATTSHSYLWEYGQSLARAVSHGENNTILPLITYQGTNRRLSQRIRKKANEHPSQWSRISGYAECLASRPNFDQFMDWYGWLYMSYREAQIVAMERKTEIPENDLRFSHIIEAIQMVIDTVIQPVTGWHRLEYSIGNQKQLQMLHNQHGIIPVTMLSDGLRNVIALVIDIAHRAFRLNPHLGINAAKETDGIVLIDEVDMFLHPKWQQTILKSLTDAFPKMQFIVTTHSPQVLSTVRRENIRILPEGKMPLAMTYGEPSGYVMQGVMGVDPQPPVTEKADLQRLTEWVNQNQYETKEAVDLLEKLKNTLGTHPQLQRLERSMQRQKMLKEMDKAKP